MTKEEETEVRNVLLTIVRTGKQEDKLDAVRQLLVFEQTVVQLELMRSQLEA